MPMPTTRELLDTPNGSARMLWRDGEWHRLTPILQAWAGEAIPQSYGFSGDDIDDLIAKVIVRAWTSPRIPDAPRQWVVTVVRNLARDTKKTVYESARRVQDFDMDTVESPEADADTRDDPEYRQQVGRLRIALRRLADPMRRVVVLHVMHGRSHREIAETLGITEGVSKMRMHRGVRMLARLYALAPTPALNRVGVPIKPQGRPPRPVAWRELPQHSGVPDDRRASFHVAQMRGAL
jgi:RNA polymerase sigma factor (sigma-70 family)